MSEKVNPLVGRAAELDQYVTSDLSVEENLAGGASVDDLIAAGVLYDDYDPDNNPVYSFTPVPSNPPVGPPLSEEEFQALMNKHSFKYSRMAAEERKKLNRRATWT